MPEVMMALGGYRFAIGTAAYQTLRRATEYRWAQMNRIGRRPAMQYVGPGIDSIDLDGVIYPHFRGGLWQVETMRTEAGLGAPLMLVAGTGYGLGRWVILSVEETESVFMSNGAPRKIEFRLGLKAYGDDFDAGAEAAVGGR
jgi:uncharacterized protein